MRRMFEGHNELSGIINAVCWAIATTAVLAMALLHSSAWGFLWVCCVSMTPVIYFGARFRLTITEEGVVLKNFAIWPLGRSKEYFLDCRAELYEAWESDSPEGVFLNAGTWSDSSDVFGPYFDQAAMSALAGQVNDAIERARKLRTDVRPLNVPGLDPADFAVLDYAAGGVPRTVRNLRTLVVAEVSIPVGSTFCLHYEEWVDAARVDTVRTVDLAASTTLHGIEISAGGRLSFWRGAVTVTGLPLAFQYGDVFVTGGKRPVTFREAELVRYTSATPQNHGGYVLPALSEISNETLLGRPVRRVTLGGAMDVAGVTAERGDTVTFSEKWKPHYVSLQRDVAWVDNTRLEGVLQPLIIRRGTVDLADCKQRGLIAPTYNYVSSAERLFGEVAILMVALPIHLALWGGTALLGEWLLSLW